MKTNKGEQIYAVVLNTRTGSVSQATDILLSYYTMPVYWYSKQKL